MEKAIFAERSKILLDTDTDLLIQIWK